MVTVSGCRKVQSDKNHRIWVWPAPRLLPSSPSGHSTFETLFLMAVALLTLDVSNLSAQSLTVLHSFSAASDWPPTNSDGAQPDHAGLVLSGNILYGTTYYGGTNGNGVVFSVDTAGNNFAVLHTFTATPSPAYTNLDGQAPQGGLVLLADRLYGTALLGGTNGSNGTVYSITTNGTSFVMLHSFDSVNDGADPVGPLVVFDHRLYGVTGTGGTNGGHGTVFAVNTDGTDFRVLHALSEADGDLPSSGLLLSGGTLYGTAAYRGTNDNGTVFSVNTNGSSFTLLHTFSPTTSPAYTNFDGAHPQASLVQSGDRLYGTATDAGPYTLDGGTLFSVTTNGGDFKVVHAFTSGWDGGSPVGLMLVGGTLYGVTEVGGATGNGVVFSVDINGSNFSAPHSFGTVSYLSYTNFDGVFPEGALVLSGNTFYGTTAFGGSGGNGTVFALSVVPSITGISATGTTFIINGINSVAGESCIVLASTNLTLQLSDWTPVVTNVFTGSTFTISNGVNPNASQQFYILHTY